MAWQIEGRYFENCSCDMPCPCTVTFDAGADRDRCHAFLVFAVDSGEIDGVDVGGLTVASVIDSPKVMTDGGWRLALVVDEKASDEQVQKLAGVFGGEMGGPMAAVAPLVGEVLGIERLPMEVTEEDGRHVLRGGDSVQIAVTDVAPLGPDAPSKLDNSPHPAGPTLTITRNEQSSWSVLGLEADHPAGRSGFAAPFSWSG